MGKCIIARRGGGAKIKFGTFYANGTLETHDIGFRPDGVICLFAGSTSGQYANFRPFFVDAGAYGLGCSGLSVQPGGSYISASTEGPAITVTDTGFKFQGYSSKKFFYIAWKG